MTEQSKPSLIQEMTICGAQTVDVLHISSWDTDHCRASELTDLLQTTRPRKIECPGYKPYSESAIASQNIINDYINSRRHSNTEAKIQYITPEYINGLEQAIELAYRDTFYNPIWIHPNCQNNNSTITHFRKGCYNLLSLGDVECPNISARLRRSRLLKLETDIMILAHHGADNGFTNKALLERIAPSLTICSSDYNNSYDHPREEIRNLLFDREIPLMTTKTGDVIVESTGNHTGNYMATNLIGDSTKRSSQRNFVAKKRKLLSYNGDTIRQIYQLRPSYPR